MFLNDPIYLPCYCWVCGDHLSDNSDTIRCGNCDEVFPKSKKFKPNNTAQKIIEEDLHLSEETKQSKKTLSKLILDMEMLLVEFAENQGNFEMEVHERFTDLRRKIDTQREELKKKIDDIALEMIDQTKEDEREIISTLKNKYSKFSNRNILNESNGLLSKFRDPNILIKEVEAFIKRQEQNVSQIKKNMQEFKLQIDQTKSVAFEPNLLFNDKGFGNLNLNNARVKACQMLVSSSSDKTIKFWDLGTFKCYKTLNAHNALIWKVEMLPNKQIISCSRDSTIKLWDIDTGLCLKTFSHDSEVCCSKRLSDTTFASGTLSEIKIWNISDGICIKSLIGHTNFVRDLVLLPNGSLVSCSQDKTIKVWDLEKGICTKTLNGHTFDVYCLLVLNNANLASGSEDNTIKIWDLESATCITTLVGHNGWVWNLLLSKTGELISASFDKTIKIWNLENATCVKTLNGHTGSIRSIKTYKDNLLISSSEDKTIKIWNLVNGVCVQTLSGHTGAVESLSLV